MMNDEELAMEIEYIDMLQTEAEQNDLLLLADYDRLSEIEELLEEVNEMLLKAEEFELSDSVIQDLDDIIESLEDEKTELEGGYL